MRLSEYRFHRRQSGCRARFDVRIYPPHHTRRYSYLFLGIIGGVGEVDIGHDGGQFVEEGVVAVDLERKCSPLAKGYTIDSRVGHLFQELHVLAAHARLTEL